MKGAMLLTSLDPPGGAAAAIAKDPVAAGFIL